MKKFLSILLAAMMVLAMTTAFAAGTNTITINNGDDGHIYEAYQVFTGKLSENGATLTEIAWGNGITEAGKAALISQFVTGVENPTVADLAAALTQGNVEAFATAVAAVLSDNVAGTSTETTSPYTISGLDTGYYFVKDKDGSLEAKPEHAYTKYILKLVQDIEVTPKTEGLTSKKKVEEDDAANLAGVDAEAYLGGQYNDVADYNIGDAIDFAIYTDLPSDKNMKYYSTYPLTVHDKMSEGLTFDASSLTVEVDGHGLTAETQYTLVQNPGDGCTFHVVITDLNTLLDNETDYTYSDDAKVVVEYQAALNEKAVIGAPGNPNESYVTFRNNPNVETDYSDTPEDEVLVFTYEIDVDKTDGKTAAKLEGVKFTLYTDEACTTPVYVDADGFVTSDSDNGNSELVTNSEGKIAVKGLDEGTYWLKETDAKDGYNELIGAVKIQLSANTNNSQDYTPNTPATAFTGVSATLTTSDDATSTNGGTNGIVTVAVKNFSGAQLPSTGGIGTTLFYLFGSIMAAGSALILVVRRRAEAEEE